MVKEVLKQETTWTFSSILTCTNQRAPWTCIAHIGMVNGDPADDVINDPDVGAHPFMPSVTEGDYVSTVFLADSVSDNLSLATNQSIPEAATQEDASKQ